MKVVEFMEKYEIYTLNIKKVFLNTNWMKILLMLKYNFCFEKELKKPEMLGVRPRNIGVCEYKDRFVISFLEPPNLVEYDAMKEWVKGVSL